MAGAYYKPCKEFDICNELIEKYWESKQYDKCFEGHLVLAEQGYPLAECQDRKSTRLNSSHREKSRMPSSA